MSGHRGVVDRFFDRQRREILARAASRSAARRHRSALALLAAAAALWLAVGLAFLNAAPEPEPRSAWLFELPLVEPPDAEDGGLLAAIGTFDGEGNEETLPALPPLFAPGDDPAGIDPDALL